MLKRLRGATLTRALASGEISGKLKPNGKKCARYNWRSTPSFSYTRSPRDVRDAAPSRGKGRRRLNIVKMSISRKTDVVSNSSAVLPKALDERRGSGRDRPTLR